MKDLIMLVIETHLVLSFGLIITLSIVRIKKLGFRRFYREVRDAKFWYVIIWYMIIWYMALVFLNHMWLP